MQIMYPDVWSFSHCIQEDILESYMSALKQQRDTTVSQGHEYEDMYLIFEHFRNK